MNGGLNAPVTSAGTILKTCSKKMLVARTPKRKSESKKGDGAYFLMCVEF
ncbi:hypothetical protein PI125_g26603 [Phytophthora idaei]|nr:hypothetical protein PI125_g26603 [Phytophthora idaei]